MKLKARLLPQPNGAWRLEVRDHHNMGLVRNSLHGFTLLEHAMRAKLVYASELCPMPRKEAERIRKTVLEALRQRNESC